MNSTQNSIVYASIVNCFISTFVSYTVLVQTNTTSYYIKKRFREFYELHLALGKIFLGKLPPFPEKVWIGNVSQPVIQDRYLMLKHYCEFLISHSNLQKLKIVKKFFAQQDESK